MDWMKELLERLAENAEYQQLLRTLEEIDSDYEALRSSLPKKEQKLLDDYITVCEEMDHIMMRFAYDLGRERG